MDLSKLFLLRITREWEWNWKCFWAENFWTFGKISNKNQIAAGKNAGVGKHLAAARCRFVKKLLPSRAEPRPNWSRIDRNHWHKDHTAVSTDKHNPYRSEHLIAAKQAQISHWLSAMMTYTSCNKLACAKHPLFLLRADPQNNAMLKPSSSAKTFADPWCNKSRPCSKPPESSFTLQQ